MDDKNPAKKAAEKMASGSLMTIEEVAARLSVSPVTVHRLPLPSIRIGRLLRFDPKDVEAFLDRSREALVALGEFAQLRADMPVEVQRLVLNKSDSRFAGNFQFSLSQFQTGLS